MSSVVSTAGAITEHITIAFRLIWVICEQMNRYCVSQTGIDLKMIKKKQMNCWCMIWHSSYNLVKGKREASLNKYEKLATEASLLNARFMNETVNFLKHLRTQRIVHNPVNRKKNVSNVHSCNYVHFNTVLMDCLRSGTKLPIAQEIMFWLTRFCRHKHCWKML